MEFQKIKNFCLNRFAVFLIAYFSLVQSTQVKLPFIDESKLNKKQLCERLLKYFQMNSYLQNNLDGKTLSFNGSTSPTFELTDYSFKAIQDIIQKINGIDYPGPTQQELDNFSKIILDNYGKPLPDNLDTVKAWEKYERDNIIYFMEKVGYPLPDKSEINWHDYHLGSQGELNTLYDRIYEFYEDTIPNYNSVREWKENETKRITGNMAKYYVNEPSDLTGYENIVDWGRDGTNWDSYSIKDKWENFENFSIHEWKNMRFNRIISLMKEFFYPLPNSSGMIWYKYALGSQNELDKSYNEIKRFYTFTIEPFSTTTEWESYETKRIIKRMIAKGNEPYLPNVPFSPSWFDIAVKHKIEFPSELEIKIGNVLLNNIEKDGTLTLNIETVPETDFSMFVDSAKLKIDDLEFNLLVDCLKFSETWKTTTTTDTVTVPEVGNPVYTGWKWTKDINGDVYLLPITWIGESDPVIDIDALIDAGWKLGKNREGGKFYYPPNWTNVISGNPIPTPDDGVVYGWKSLSWDGNVVPVGPLWPNRDSDGNPKPIKVEPSNFPITALGPGTTAVSYEYHKTDEIYLELTSFPVYKYNNQLPSTSTSTSSSMPWWGWLTIALVVVFMVIFIVCILLFVYKR